MKYVWVKYLVAFGSLAIATTGGTIGYGQLKEKATFNKEQIQETKLDVKEVKKDVRKNSDINIKHSVVLERTVKILDKLEERMTKK